MNIKTITALIVVALLSVACASQGESSQTSSEKPVYRFSRGDRY